MAAIKSRRDLKAPGAPCKAKSGIDLTHAKLPPSFQKQPTLKSHDQLRGQSTHGSFGPLPSDDRPSAYLSVGGGVSDSVLSEAEQQLQKLLAKQLDTSQSSLANALGHVREYTPAVVFQPLANEMKGLHTLSQFVSKEEEVSKVDSLRQMGLTEKEIEMKLKEEGLSDLKPSPAKKSKLGAEPKAQQERLDALNQKISSRERMIHEPMKYTGVKHMSRHAMEVERSLFRGSDVGNPLLHLTREERDDGTHEMAYPKSIMPSNESLVEESPDSSKQDDSLSQQCDIPALPVQVIERNCLTTAEIRALPRFREYTPGTPSNVLYLKNLDSKVTADDLQAVFGGAMSTSSVPHIKVMTGKMKGQAFIHFDTIDNATKALQLVNGYKMRGRPAIISYGRARPH